jgi:hypothetical protein
VIVLRGHQLRPPQPELTLTPGDRISLLAAAPGSSPNPIPAANTTPSAPTKGTSTRM